MFHITSAVSVLGAYKPCPREACRFWFTLFCSLLILNVSRVHISPKCDTALSWVCRNSPAMREVDWMNGFRHNKNANRDRHTDISAFIREKNVQPPSSEASNIRCWLLPKLWSSNNSIRTSPNLYSYHSWYERVFALTFKSLGTEFIYFLLKKEMNTSIQQRCIKSSMH